MNKKIVSGIALILLLLSMLTLAFNIELVEAEPGTWTVDDDGPADFSTIQGAINAASPGDTIYVKAGTYREPQVTINKPLQLIGENKNTTIVDGDEIWVCLYVQNTQNVTISGFTVQNGFGLYAWDSENVTISRNIIINNSQGIHIGDSTNVIVSKNIVTQNDSPFHMSNSHSNKIYENIFVENNYEEDCVWLDHSSNNSIYENTIKHNDGDGIRFDWSFNNRIYGNNITNNGLGIRYWASSNNSIHGNNIEDNWSGIWLSGYPGNLSSFNTIYWNNITNNDDYGVKFAGSSNNTLTGNSITNNHHGVLLVQSSYNTISSNNITNRWDGIDLFASSNNNVQGNNITSNKGDGVNLSGSSSYNSVSGNNITNNESGIEFWWSPNNTISKNNIKHNHKGIILHSSSNNEILGNEITNNNEGIKLHLTSYMYIGKNYITNNNYSIVVENSGYNEIRENNIETNNFCGIWLRLAFNNSIYHNNFIDNTWQVYFETSYANFWDDGYPSGGNYWSDYTGLDLYGGLQQNETGSDGIGDTRYFIDENNQDDYPLMNPWASSVEPTTWTVDDDGPADFSSIQEAIDAANSGDTIFVRAGTYYEHVVISKSVSLIGENRSSTLIDGNGTGTVITVSNVKDVIITELTAQNGIGGISLVGTRNITLTRNNMRNNQYNFFVGSTGGPDPQQFTHNIDSSNTVDRKPIYYWVDIHNDTIPQDAGFVALVNSTNITVQNLRLSNNGEGLLLVNSNACKIVGNYINNSLVGLAFGMSYNNTIVGNTISLNHILCYNFYGFANNILYHNNFLNSSLFHTSELGSNIWDNGYPSGGNYWSDYEERYPDAQELDGSGIWDTPYVINVTNQDNFPLMETWSPKPPRPVEATQELIETIETWNLSKGAENSLKAKLKVAIHMLDMGKDDGAIQKLTAFTNRVEMLREKTLTNEQADELVSEAQRIIDLING